MGCMRFAQKHKRRRGRLDDESSLEREERPDTKLPTLIVRSMG
jgi:hypothetical protein